MKIIKAKPTVEGTYIYGFLVGDGFEKEGFVKLSMAFEGMAVEQFGIDWVVHIDEFYSPNMAFYGPLEEIKCE